MGVILNPQYVVDNQQSTKAVLLSLEEWEQILEELEELEDIRAYDSAKSGSQEAVLFCLSIFSKAQKIQILRRGAP